MKKSPLWLLIFWVVFSAVVAAATFATRVEPCVPSPDAACSSPNWLDAVGLWLKPHAATTLFAAAILGLLVQVYEKVFGWYGFRKSQVEKFLNAIVVAQLKNDARKHRLTLFRRIGGFRAFLIALWRWWKQESSDEKRFKRRAALAIKWRGTYLYVYARASKAPNKQSSIVWRVYKDGRGSEGVAGTAWDQGEVVIVRDLSRIRPDTAKNVRALTETSPEVQMYAKMANITNIVHIQGMRHVAQHFMGVVIETSEGEPWGVLLVDSMNDECPFPGGDREEKLFKRQFRNHAAMLSLLLS